MYQGIAGIGAQIGVHCARRAIWRKLRPQFGYTIIAVFEVKKEIPAKGFWLGSRFQSQKGNSDSKALS
jgi:hypothetical protein